MPFLSFPGFKIILCINTSLKFREWSRTIYLKMDKYDSDLEHCEVSGTNMDQNKDDLLASYVPDTEEEKALVRKFDLYLLPTIWLMYLLSYMDRTKWASSDEDNHHTKIYANIIY